MSTLNYEDIKNAAEGLKALSMPRTNRSVRDYLNQGSLSTITPLLRRWKEENGELVIKEDAQDLPGPLKSLLMKYINHEKTQLNDEIKHLRADLQAIANETNQIKKENANQAETIRTLEANLNQEKGALKNKDELIDRLYKQIENEKAAVIKATAEAYSAGKELAKARENITKLSEDHQQYENKIKALEKVNHKLTESLIDIATRKSQEEEAELNEPLKSI
jgi:chromosome segregation ATPase